MPEVEFGKTLPYAFAAQLYLDAGWLPVPVRGKDTPVKGYTGKAGAVVTSDLVQQWQSEAYGGWNIGLRMQRWTVGIDVDGYVPKTGDAALAALERELGALPATWRSTSRLNDVVSGIRFYHVPADAEVWDLHVDIQVIRHSWRYAVAWPSVHPESGAVYRWFDPSGQLADESRVPAEAELPDLPPAWLERCRQGREPAAGSNGSADRSARREGRTSSYTDPDVPWLEANGIPSTEPHDDTLRDVVWKLYNAGHTEREVYAHWRRIVERTVLKRADEPFTDVDFRRHWAGAVANSASPVTPAQRAWALTLPRDDSGTETRADDTAQSDSEAAAGDDGYVSDAEKVLALTEALIVRSGGRGIDFRATHEELPRSDMAAARFIRSLVPGDFTYSLESKIWRKWDGSVHRHDIYSEIEALIGHFGDAYKNAMRSIQDAVVEDRVLNHGETEEEAREFYKDVWKKHRAYRDLVWNESGHARIQRQLERQCRVSETLFDILDSYVVSDNGVIGISAQGAVLFPHDKSKLVTLRLGYGVEYRADAEAPVFRHFLETSIKNEETRKWLQQSLGLALIGKPGKGFVNLIGKTNSGKSTLVRALQNVLGTYAAPVSVETFLEGPGNNDFRLHSLKGVRFAFASEPAAGRKLDTEAVKSITGGDRQETRKPYGDFVTWKPQCVIVIASNQPIKFETSDTAVLNRIEAIAFSDKHDTDHELDDKLEAEADGILRWLVEGAIEALRLGPARKVPEPMLELREAMATHIDDTLQFVQSEIEEMRLIADPAAPAVSCVTVGELYTRYQVWAAMEGMRFTVTKRQFTARIGRNWPVVKSQGSRFAGLRLTGL